MDKVIWVDEHDKELGIIEKEKAHREGLCDRIVIVYVTRANGDILVQERMDDGRLDHSAAGHVDPGEDYFTAAMRELKEELGVVADLTEIGRGMSGEKGLEVDGYNICHLFKVYVCQAEPRALAKREVKSVYWANPHDVWREMEKDYMEKKYCGAFKVSLKIYLDFLIK
ncbi:MAG: NUDIX domain-containing protein [bacterium]|nr:NUDIX domain-containing protein [bacterium]